MKPTESTPWRSPLRSQKAFAENGQDEATATPGEIDRRLRTEKTSVVPQKTVTADIRRFAFVLVELGMVLSLSLLLGMLKAPIHFQSEFAAPETEAVVVEMEEVEQTEQVKKPPPPPRPPVPISVPDETVLEDEILDIDAEIDIESALQLPDLPPPPANEDEEDEAEIFVVVEQMPELIGGIQSLYAVIVYPDLALRAGIEGTVVVQFVIETTGIPTSTQIMKSAGSILDTAALQAVEKLRFKPGMQRGKPVRVRYALPVRFRLTEAQANS